MWNNHMTKALPCINAQQTAAKTISKDQQTLDIINIITVTVQIVDVGSYKTIYPLKFVRVYGF